MFSLVQLALLSVVACSSAKNIGIVGGDEIDIKEAPYQVSIIFASSLLCGGTVVGKNVIITAAHCLEFNEDPILYKIRAGSKLYKEGGVIRQVRDIAIHESYVSSTKGYDVALMWLSEPLVFSDVIRPIGMAGVGEEIPDGGMCVVTGWGLTKEGASVSSTLRSVAVPKVSQENCANAYEDVEITTTMVCAGFIGGGKDACQGDSGGPLVYNNKLSGIVSWGRGCARPNYPGVYANVATLRSWIDANINKLKMKHGGITA